MTKYPILYKRNTNGTINQWQIIVNGKEFYTIEGLQGGALTTSKPTLCEAKNIGRANATTPEEQAKSEAESKIQKKLDKGYTENIKKVDTCKTTFTPMLAHKYNDYKAKIQFPVLASTKIDGLRYIAREDGGWTRNGKPYVSVPHIQRILTPVFDKHPDWIIDGEIYSEDVPFEEIVSLVKKGKPEAQDLAESEKKCKLYIFDGVIDDVNSPFEVRFKTIKDEIAKLVGKDSHLKFVENVTVKTHDELMTLHDEYVKQGWEGIMIRKVGSVYENKRSKNLLKYKSFLDKEFKILDIVEGIGSRAGMAGKLVIEIGKGETCEAGIKGGEDFYKSLLKNRSKLIGKKATVRYQGVTDKGSLRFPVAVVIDPFDR
jgi:DNA ligase-1